MLKLLNFDETYHNNPGEILPVRENLVKKSLVKKYITDIFLFEDKVSFKASCGCGALQGNFYEGTKCPDCGEIVQYSLAHDMTYRFWLQLPTFAPPVLNPKAYRILDSWLGSYDKGTRFLNVLLGNDEQPLPKELSWYTPGWKSFYENFDPLMDFLLNQYKIHQRASRKTETERIRAFIQYNRNALFANLFPILNSTLHLITHTGELKYVDQTVNHIIEMIVDISMAQHRWDNMNKGVDFINKSMKAIYDSYLNYTESIMNVKLINTVNPKRGFIRKHMMGSRFHFTFRSVIVPITEPAMADEIHLPWRIAVEGLKLEIINVLVNRRNMDVISAQTKVEEALQTYNPDIHDIIKTLIFECPYKGLPIIGNRNPSLIHGAIQLFYFTKVLIDDNVVKTHPIAMVVMNGDYDGDQLNFLFVKEMAAVEAFKNIHPMQTMFAEDRPGIDKTVRITDQAETVLQAWLLDGNSNSVSKAKQKT